MAERDQKGEMTEGELLALIEQAEEDSLGGEVAAGAAVGGFLPAAHKMSTLEVDRYNALQCYYGRSQGDELEGHSTVVLPEMRDIVEWTVPQLLQVLVAGPICEFDPQGPDDVKAAALETAAINHIFMRQNDGFLIAHDAVKDALILRNGYIRAMVETKETSEVLTFTGLTEIQMAKLLSDKADEKVEILGQRMWQQDVPSQQPVNQKTGQPPIDPSMLPLEPMTVWDIKLRRTKSRRRIKIDCMPPEEMLIHAQCRGSLDEARFIQHHSYVTRTELIEQGYDEDEVNDIPGEQEPSTELVPLARMVVTDQLSVSDPADLAVQTICKRDIIMQVDYDGDGVAELRHIVMGGRTILENEEVDEVCYVGGSTTRMPHRHTGLSYFDELADIQAIKTSLARGLLDNARLVNNPRVAVDFQNCNMEDLMTARDGGIIRTKGPPGNALMPFQHPFVGDKILPIMDTVDSWREMRTGVGKDTVGLDADALQNVTKGGMLAGLQAASLKIELKARMLAETIFAPLFCLVHSLVRKHPDTLTPFQHRGQWVNLDPTLWCERTSCSPAVGLGSGQREEMRSNMMLLAQAQQALLQALMQSPPPVYKKAWNTFSRMCQLLGFNNPEQYGIDPDGPEYGQLMQMQQQQHANPPPNPMLQVQQAKNQGAMQLQQAKTQSDMQMQQMESQRDLMNMKAKLLQEQQQHLRDQQSAFSQQQHDIATQGRDHANDQHQQMNDNAMQIGLTLLKVLAPIIASQLKGDPSANAGQILLQDERDAGGSI